MADHKLTNKQTMWCHEYLVDLNATQAAIRAGYSEDAAKQQGYENLAKPYLKAKIQSMMDLRAERLEITADKVLVELAKIGFADVREIFGDGEELLTPSQFNDNIAAAVQSIEVVTKVSEDKDGKKTVDYVHKIKMNDKKAALECLGKNLKLFTDKVDVDANLSGGISISWQGAND